jgi:dynein intermediate chain 1
MDFHPHSHALLAVGCYDGTVKVYDIRRNDSTPLYVSDIKSGKHTDPVWEVKWQDDVGSDMHFFSVSSDGRVANWVLSKNELKMEPVMSLKLAPAGPSGNNEQALAMEEDSSLTGLAGGCCLDFNKYEDHLFLVGTEEGRIHKCSKAYSGQYLETYDGHHMAVYAVRWNPFHPKVCRKVLIILVH